MQFVRFLAANITGRKSVDIICVQDRLEYDTLRQYMTASGISFNTLEEDEAAKLLIADDGVGCGCYTMYHTKEAERAYRQALARARKNDISAYSGIIMLDEPVEVCVAIEAIEPIERMTFLASILGPNASLAPLHI